MRSLTLCLLSLRCFRTSVSLSMTPSTSQEDVSASTLPAPHPTQPVARRLVTDKDRDFRWTAVPEADTYRIQLAASDAFSDVYYDQTVEGPRSLQLDELLPRGTGLVAWRVRAETPEGPWSAPAYFTMSAEAEGSDEASFLVDAPPVPVHPLEGETVDPGAATFTWDGIPEASGYRLQVSQSDAFGDPLVDLTVDQTTSVTLYNRLPQEAATLSWRVSALFPSDAEGPWGAVVQFQTDPGKPTNESASDVDEPSNPENSSVESSPVAAGPARHAQTSSTVALFFAAILVVSFIVTIVLIYWLI